MKVVILAAGRGKRFGTPYPKTLATLANGVTILDWQLSCIQPIVPLQDIRVVVGFEKEMISSKRPQLTTILNPDFDRENTAKSLLRGLDGIKEDCIWLNGDVVFHPSVFQKIVECGKTCMVVNRAAVGEEEVKYRTYPRGQIVEVSKTVLKGEGEALGINYFSAQDLPLLKNSLQECRPTDFFEKGVELCLAKGCVIAAVEVAVDRCIEIDFPKDLKNANQLISQWKDEGF